MTYDPRAPFGHLSNARPPGDDPDGDPSAEHPDAPEPPPPTPGRDGDGRAIPYEHRTGSGYRNDPTTPGGPAGYGQQGYAYDDRTGGGAYGNDPTTPGGPAGYGPQGYGYEDRSGSGGYAAEGYGGTAPYGQAPPGPEPTRPTEPAGYGYEQSGYGNGGYGGTAPYGQPAPGYDPTRPGYEQAAYEQVGYGQPPGYGPPPAGYGYEQPSYGQGVRPPVPPPSGMSTAALVLGILGVLTGLIPLLFFIAFPLGVLALVLGLIAYTRGRRLGVGQGRAGSWLGGIAVVLSIVGLAIVADAFDDLDDATNGSRGNPDEPAVSSGDDGEQDVFAVGQTAHTGDFDVTLHTVTDPFTPASQFERPQANNRFVAVEVEVTNTSDENQVMSTLAGAELTDSQNRGWNIAIAGTDLPQLDGQVPPGDARRGWVVFEVAQDATDLRLRIKGNLTATGSLFDLG